ETPPMTPGIALKIAAARYAPLRLHLAERADSTSLSRPPSGHRPGGQSWMRACVLANFLDAPNPLAASLPATNSHASAIGHKASLTAIPCPIVGFVAKPTTLFL
ncbi:TPA: hypothetical protein ACNGY8_004454, partial [Klebsiella michiganensis]